MNALKGKKRMKAFGTVNIPQEAVIEVLREVGALACSIYLAKKKRNETRNLILAR